ncbi:MAG: NAD(P)-dependent oxidoreductase, partial [Comamonadaceae bacterium]
MRVAVLGLGLMGLPMARRLCQAGLEVHVWNRTISKAEVLLPLGATVHLTPAMAVAQANLTITMLEHGGVVESVVFEHGVAQAMRKDSLLVDMSSIEPAQAKDHAKRLQALNIRYLDAPVSGGTIGAEQGSLAIMAGGNVIDFETARPVLEHLGRSTLVGPTGCGQLAKLANQMIVGITIGAVAEALLLCEKGGADMAQVKAAITGGFADSR